MSRILLLSERDYAAMDAAERTGWIEDGYDLRIRLSYARPPSDTTGKLVVVDASHQASADIATNAIDEADVARIVEALQADPLSAEDEDGGVLQRIEGPWRIRFAVTEAGDQQLVTLLGLSARHAVADTAAKAEGFAEDGNGNWD